MDTSSLFNGVRIPLTILVVNGEVKKNLSNSAVTCNPTQDLYNFDVTIPRTLYQDYSVPPQQDIIHQVVPYNANMDLTSAYLPPTPILNPLSLTIASGWWNTQGWLAGTRSDAAGIAPTDLGFYIMITNPLYSFTSQWSGAVLRAHANEQINGVYVNRSLVNNKVYLNVIDHVTDRATGKLTSFPVAIELVGGNMTEPL